MVSVINGIWFGLKVNFHLCAPLFVAGWLVQSVSMQSSACVYDFI